MRDNLPIKIERPQRGDSPEIVTQRLNFEAQVSQMALFRVFRVTTTGTDQVLNAGVPIGTWFVGRKSNYVDVREKALNGQQLTYQASAAGADIDIIVLF